MDQNKTIIIACGGTGGHLYPGIALAREVKKRGYNPIFVVRENDLSCKILESEQIKYIQIPIIGMPRRLSFTLIKFIYLFIKSIFRAMEIIDELKPVKVAGMGGYISAPTVVAAWFKGVKVVLHESNYLPGLANRFLKHFAQKVAIGFKDSEKYFPSDKAVFTGNPVRVEIFNKPGYDVYSKYKLSSERFTVFVFGGSQGAKGLNKNILDSLKLMVEVKDSMQFIHITGKNDFQSAEYQYTINGFKACVLPYLETIGDAYYMADLIISRSGASTVTELEILNKPAILIPFPFATENHQEYNAKALVNMLKAVMIKEKDLSPDIISTAIKFQLKSFTGHKFRIEMPSPLPQEKLADLVLN